MPAVEEDISRIMRKNLSLAAFLPNSKELIGVVILCPKEVGLDKYFNFTWQEVNDNRFQTADDSTAVQATIPEGNPYKCKVGKERGRHSMSSVRFPRNSNRKSVIFDGSSTKSDRQYFAREGWKRVRFDLETIERDLANFDLRG